MDLYRTSESGLVAVQPLDPDETAGLAGSLLHGPGGELGAEDVLFVTTADGDGAATALALDAEGSVVVVVAVDGSVGSETVTEALQRASAVANRPYEALDEQYDGGSLREAHAEYFTRAPLDPEAFNEDQRVRLLGTGFADEALELATFLSDRELAVDAVRVEAFGAPESEAFLVRFVPHEEEAAESADGAEQWVAGATASAGGRSEPDSSEVGAVSDDSAHESAAAADDGVDDDIGAEGETGSENGTGGDGRDGGGSGDGTDEGDGTGGAEESESLELSTLLDAVADGIQDRLVGTFDSEPEDLVSVERGNELLVRPDHPAYAGGVLRYRLQIRSDGAVEFGVNIYGGSEAEKEQMRAVVRENEAAIEEELAYEIADGYDGFAASRQFATFDQVAAAEIVDEFDRLVRFFHSRVMRA